MPKDTLKKALVIVDEGHDLVKNHELLTRLLYARKVLMVSATFGGPSGLGKL